MAQNTDATDETYSGAGVEEPKHKWSGREFCDCPECTGDEVTAEVTGTPEQVAEIVTLAFNAGKDVTIKTGNDDVSHLHEEFENTRDENEMSVEVTEWGTVRLTFSVFFVGIDQDTTAYIYD